jgi:prevent-host-death family protein
MQAARHRVSKAPLSSDTTCGGAAATAATARTPALLAERRRRPPLALSVRGFRSRRLDEQSSRKSSRGIAVLLRLLPVTTVIPQGKLRNEVGAVLRRAERGERFTVTVAGRPVAELGPLPGRRVPAPPGSLARIVKETPVDPSWREELLAEREEVAAITVDPWSE